jgi:tRNA threonylcarbamoyladenosine biosynthesis protein TsaE
MTTYKPIVVERCDALEDMLLFAKQLGARCKAPMVIFLKGEMGAGKTTFVGGLLSGLGFQGKVKSPTYTIVEPYCLPVGELFHFDFFRLKSDKEAESLGLEDYFRSDTICIVEWPEKASSQLPSPDYLIEFSYPESSLSPEASTYRHLCLYAMNERAYQLCLQS